MINIRFNAIIVITGKCLNYLVILKKKSKANLCYSCSFVTFCKTFFSEMFLYSSNLLFKVKVYKKNIQKFFFKRQNYIKKKTTTNKTKKQKNKNAPNKLKKKHSNKRTNK